MAETRHLGVGVEELLGAALPVFGRSSGRAPGPPGAAGAVA
nr:hypothetical protein [Actinomadura spongiicola]